MSSVKFASAVVAVALCLLVSLENSNAQCLDKSTARIGFIYDSFGNDGSEYRNRLSNRGWDQRGLGGPGQRLQVLVNSFPAFHNNQGEFDALFIQAMINDLFAMPASESPEERFELIMDSINEAVDYALKNGTSNIYVMTPPPAIGNSGWSTRKQAAHDLLAAKIRTFDGPFIKHFDLLAVLDQDSDGELDPIYDSGDHLHPNGTAQIYLTGRIEAELTCLAVPTAIEITHGSTPAPNPTDLLLSSDNRDLRIVRSASSLAARTEFIVTSTSRVARPSTFVVELEGAVFSRGETTQKIELYDYNVGAWETVDSRTATRSPAQDSVVTVQPNGILSRFVDPLTMEVKARVGFEMSITTRQAFTSNTDRFYWVIEP